MQLARSEHDPLLLPAMELNIAIAVLERLPLAVIVVDQTGRIWFANAHVVHLFRFAQTEFMGQPVEFFFPAALRAQGCPTVSEWLSVAEGNGATLSLAAQGVRKDGVRVGLQLRRGEFSAGGQPLTLCTVHEERTMPAMHDLALTCRTDSTRRSASPGSAAGPGILQMTATGGRTNCTACCSWIRTSRNDRTSASGLW